MTFHIRYLHHERATHVHTATYTGTDSDRNGREAHAASTSTATSKEREPSTPGAHLWTHGKTGVVGQKPWCETRGSPRSRARASAARSDGGRGARSMRARRRRAPRGRERAAPGPHLWTQKKAAAVSQSHGARRKDCCDASACATRGERGRGGSRARVNSSKVGSSPRSTRQYASPASEGQICFCESVRASCVIGRRDACSAAHDT